MEAQALQMARLSPMEQGQFGIALGAQQLGRAIGGALGGVDPQLQKITQRQQLIGMIDPSNPDSYAQAIQAALQTGDQEAAFLLRNEMMRVQEQASIAENRRFEREGRLIERGQGMQQRGLESRALSIASGIDPDTGEPTTPLLDPQTQTFNQNVANKLISEYGQVGTNIVKQRLEGFQGIETLQEKQLARNRTSKANELFSKLKKPDGTIDEDVKAQLLAFPEGRTLITQQAEVLKPLRQLGAAGTPEEDPFKIFLDDPTIPANVKTLATQYSSSFAKGMIDPDKVDARVKDLADMTQRINQFDQSQQQIKANQDSMAALKVQGLENSQAYLALAQSQAKLAEQQNTFNQQMRVAEANRKRQEDIDKAEAKRREAEQKAEEKRNKPLRADLAKDEEADYTKASEARNLAIEANDYVNSIKAGNIKFGLKDRASIAIRSAAGSNDPDVVARNDFERFKTRLVNESLRLNKGTQTEGDAQRSIKELQGAESEVDAAKAINTLALLNARKVSDAQKSIERRRRNANLALPEVPIETLSFEPQTFTQKDVDSFLKNPKYPKGTIFVDPKGVRRVKP
jgi:hypothetical protein